jgi:hypothetical protein
MAKMNLVLLLKISFYTVDVKQYFCINIFVMTTTQSIQIYDILSIHLKNKEDAKLVVQSIEKVIDEKVETKTVVFEKIVTKDIDNLRQEMYKVFATKDDIAQLRIEAREHKIDLVKWMIALVFSAMGITITVMALLFNYYLKK